ncbi:ABC transporter ATP-binding protein/permease [Corynebacterium sanguinis]|uniref:ABC transporter ATP-binding protein n=1 Tax=Corynebacterium sanguinis TaxID=2594913 RepID=UPI00223B3888|nr:ABC transporter ATP-binding protein [Corynebacterium sanguinis]MCT1585286.1 ABC transporter ATP-binding protein/permease [Corynebacterium sanguinis]MCT2023860.1 ABC transporter ATP-binding protein/permease [Corynebacterium sanguinis]MCT2047673.1 ABC transporter ATP-binding protein/permease [Corynebacterium sanguinis]MCT2154437.1 ABC transporter ATP-binding protein/permease [Corynebacterium sanguinis]MCT2158251.1 ABC transporter ATP-binding protein/permease [Corynebacterium sanguinis]
MDLVRILARSSKPYAGYIVTVVVLQLITTLATLYLPDLNAKIIDNGVARADIPYIWRVGGVMLVVALVQVISAVVAVYFASRTAMGVGRDVRRAVFRHVSLFSAEDMSYFGTPTLITRGTNDVQQVQMVYLLFLNFMVAAPIMAVGGIIMAVRQDPGMSWLVVAAVGVLAVVVGVLIALLMPLFRSMQDKLDNVNGVLREQITGIRVVRAFGREEHETQRFTAANDDITRVSLNIGRIFVLLFPVIMLILNVATAAVLWFGGHRVDTGQVEVGSLTAFMQYLMQILMAVMMGTFMAMMLPRAVVCARRIRELLEHEPTIKEPSVPAKAPSRAGVVELEGVSYTYPGAEEPVLKEVSLRAVPGQTTAIIGSTGAGKSTLLSLIPRLTAATSGRVLLDGVDVTDMARAEIVERVSMVPQKPYLFSGTVASNLRMAKPDATDAEMWEALRTAQAHFVTDLDMPISQGGTNVSGGQRQRLSIARMLISRPRIYLFDDSFSALDAITDAKVRDAMRAYTADATTIIVAQRVASIEQADQIIVMEAGKIVARGSHAELLESSETYREIVESQRTVDA